MLGKGLQQRIASWRASYVTKSHSGYKYYLSTYAMAVNVVNGNPHQFRRLSTQFLYSYAIFPSLFRHQDDRGCGIIGVRL
jgi:hypothetical protein